MIFLFLYFGSSTFIDGYCMNRFYDNDITKRPDNFRAMYSTNHSALKNFSMLYEYSGRVPFTLQIYAIYDFCTEFTFFTEFNVSDGSACKQYRIDDSDVPYQCKFGYNIVAYNAIDLDYTLIVSKENFTNTTLSRYFTRVEYKYYRPFTINVYAKSPYFDGIQYAFSHNVNKFNESYDLFGIRLNMLPIHLRPHTVSFSADLSRFYKIAYNTSINRDLIEIGSEIINLYERDPFEVSFYIVSTMSCNEMIYLRTVQSDKNFSSITFNLNDIPKECQIDTYPDDFPPYQPPKNKISDYAYSIGFIGNCENFDDIVNKCKNHSVDYKHCSFINNAVEAICDDFSPHLINFNQKISKLFYITSDRSTDFDFEDFKHQMIVHIKATDYSNFEDYLKYYDSDIINSHSVYFKGDIKDKVSHLTLENVDPYIRNTDLNIDTVYLKNSSISTYTIYNGIRTNNLILENSYIPQISGYYFNNVVVVLRNTTSRPQFRIRDEGNPEFYYRDWYNDTYEKIKTLYVCNARKVGFLLTSHYLDFNHVDDYSYTNNYNITLYDIDDELSRLENSKLLEDTSKYYVELTHSGNWSHVRENTTVYLNGYHDLLNISNQLHPTQNLVLVDPPVYSVYEWAQKLYQPVNLSNKSLITYIYIGSYEYSCRNIVDDFNHCKYDYSCSDEAFEKARYIVDVKCTTKENLNNILKEVKEETDKLYIINEVENATINLTYLPRKMVVNIQSVYSLKSLTSLSLDKKAKKPSYSDLIPKKINIFGRIRGKVSYLTIMNSVVNIIEYKLNVQTVQLEFCEVNSDYPIESDYLIVDFTTHIFLLTSTSYKMNIKQYGLIVPYDEYDGEENVKYKISYQSNQWNLYLKTEDEENYKPIDHNYGYVPYSFADSVGLIIVSNEFDFNIPTSITDIKDVNITILNLEEPDTDMIEWAPFDDRKYIINLTYSGEWQENQKANITMTTFQDYVDIIMLNDTSLHLNVNNEKIFDFITHQPYTPSPTPDPNATPQKTPSPTQIPTATPIPEFIGNLFEEEKGTVTSEELNKALDDLYYKFKEEDGNKIAIVNAKSILFDKSMEDDQYIKPTTNSEIQFINGNINLILPDEGKVTVELHGNDDVQLQIKGDGEIEFKQKSNGNIRINNDAQINGSLKITVPDTVNSLSVNSLYVSKSGTIECISGDNMIPITLKNLSTDAQTKTKLNKFIIKDSINLVQTAQLELNDVDLKDSQINYNINNFYDLKSILTGEFNDPPKGFQLIWNYDYRVRPASGSTYMISNGVFNKNNCKDWANIITINGLYIDSYCEDSSLLQKSESLMIKIRDSPTQPESHSKHFPVGAIIGIVVGVIVVVAVVVVVIILVIKKKKNNFNENDAANEKNSIKDSFL